MNTEPIDVPCVQLPEVWREPAFVQWATALAEDPTYSRVTPPTEEEAGGIYESMYREFVLGEKPRARVSQKRKVSARGGPV